MPTASNAAASSSSSSAVSVTVGTDPVEERHTAFLTPEERSQASMDGNNTSDSGDGTTTTAPPVMSTIDMDDGPIKATSRDGSGTIVSHNNSNNDIWQTIAGVAGNVLEWYDFAVFGYFSDIIGEVFFPPNQGGDASTTETFLVFGLAFVMRPLGGILLGYLGDVYGRKKALIASIFLMAFPTFAMGCLPGYAQIGDWAIVLLVLVRLLQGLSVGGQLMSSLVFTLENNDPAQWGLYGSFVMMAANLGTLLGGVVGFAMRESMSREALVSWGWRIPFLTGIVVSLSGFYLKGHGGDHGGADYHAPNTARSAASSSLDQSDRDAGADEIVMVPSSNPLLRAVAKENLRPLLASSMVPMLWSAGFYLCFVWMAIFMTDGALTDTPVPGAFGINAAALFFSVCLLFPVAGKLSDSYGRIRIMTLGGLGIGLFSPLMVTIIGKGNPFAAFLMQCMLGIFLSLWGAPMCAWLVETFEPSARLTSISIGYNVAQALAGGSTPFLATELAEKYGTWVPGLILTALATVSMIGLRCVAPAYNDNNMMGPAESSGLVDGINREVEMVGKGRTENEII